MPSDKSDQPPQGNQASDSKVEIITPLKVRSGTAQPDSPRPQRPVAITILFFLILLASLAAGGLLFIRHVSKHAAILVEKTDQAAQLETGVQSKPLPDTANTAQRPNAALTKPATGSAAKQPATAPPQRIDTVKLGLEKEKAEKLEAVTRLIASGKNHEENNRLAFALADYQEALKLDPVSRTAEKALNRVKEQIAGQQFQKLMSDGLTAYHDGKYQHAGTKLLKAKSFRPDSREVKEALLQVDEAIRLDKIEKLRRNAMAAEQAEDWGQALKSYLTVLKIDPNISFALLGKERSLERIRISKRMSFFLQKPETMESNQQLQNAVLVIEEAEKLQSKGPRLKARLDELKALVVAYRTPVKVVIDSDNLTEIAVYKIGKLGRFTTRELSLRPGKYTVVGSRNGYKDIRRQIIVKPGQKALRITVICKTQVERIKFLK